MSVQIGSVRPQSSTAPESIGTSDPAALRTWTRDIIGGGQIEETCPNWCVSSHARDRRGMLDDLVHTACDVSMTVHGFDHWGEGVPVEAPLPILSARIQVDPYSANLRRRVPHVTFEPAPDEVVECVDPEQLYGIIARIRAHCDRLDGVLKELVVARAERRFPMA